MKKQLLLLYLLLFSFGGYAQGNWKKYYSNYIEGTTSYNEFTWIFYRQDIIRINQITQEEIKIEKPKGSYSFFSYIAINDELWLSSYGTGKLFHYKNEAWTTYQLNIDNEYKFSSINKNNNKIIVTVTNHRDFIIIDGDSLKSVTINQASLYECWGKAVLTNTNTIIYDLKLSSGIAEINTEGDLLNYFSASSIIPQGFYNEIIDIDKENNLVLITSAGIYRSLYSLSDTLFINIISSNNLDSILPSNCFINSNNQLMFGTYSDRFFVKCFNSVGVNTINYLINNKSDKNVTSLIGYDFQNRPIGINNNSNLIYCDSNKIGFYYRNKSQYIGDEIKYTQFLENETFFSGSYHHYGLRYDTLSITRFDTTHNLTDASYRAMVSDKHKNLYIAVGIKGKLYLFRKGVNSIAQFIAIIPSKPNDLDELDGIGMYYDNNSKLNVVMKYHVLTYDPLQSQKWDTITRKAAPNSLVVQKIYSFCKDSEGNIWFATDKGIAKIVNNYIVVQSNINITGSITDIKYDRKTNSILTFKEFNNTHTFYIYNLNTNQLVTLPSFNRYSEISIDSNSFVYLTSSNGIERYDLQLQKWDSLFKTNTLNTPFSKGWSYIECNKNGDVYLFGSNVFYIYNESNLSSMPFDKNKPVKLILYPNPTSGILTVDSKENPQTYSVYNMLGEVLANGKIENRKIDISELPSGVYTVKVVGDKGESYRKVIKN